MGNQLKPCICGKEAKLHQWDEGDYPSKDGVFQVGCEDHVHSFVGTAEECIEYWNSFLDPIDKFQKEIVELKKKLNTTFESDDVLDRLKESLETKQNSQSDVKVEPITENPCTTCGSQRCYPEHCNMLKEWNEYKIKQLI